MCMLLTKIALEKVVISVVYARAWSLCAVLNKMQMWWLLIQEPLEITNIFQATKLNSPNKAKKKKPTHLLDNFFF